MLTGLLFAIEDAVDDPAQLVATLPFAGTTLIEHQARQLIAAGADQIVVLGARRTPQLLGALHRIGRRGVPVDAVTGAAEAVAVLHPLARVVMLADGLVTTDAVVRLLTPEGEDALLAVPADEAPASLERIGGASAWAGVARLAVQRLADLAQLPPDYDPQASLIRLADAAGTIRFPLPATALRNGHSIERDAATLALRGRRIVAAAMPAWRDWSDRFVTAPLARLIIPPLVAQRVDTTVVAAVAVALATLGAVALIADWPRSGLLLALTAMLAAGIGTALAQVRYEFGVRHALQGGLRLTAAAAVLLLGWRCSAAGAHGGGLVVAIALVAAATLTERTSAAPAIWWGSALSFTLVVTAATLCGSPVAGLVVAACYAGATLTAAIDTLRQA